MDYWKECIEEAFEDAGIEATNAQINTVAIWINGANENFGLATGRDFIPSPMISEVEEIKRELAKQQENHERQLNGIRRGVSRRLNIDIGEVII